MNYLSEMLIFGRTEQRQLLCVMASVDVDVGTTNKMLPYLLMAQHGIYFCAWNENGCVKTKFAVFENSEVRQKCAAKKHVCRTCTQRFRQRF